MLHQLASIVTGLHAVNLIAATKTTKSSSGSIYLLLFFVIVVAYLWFRPQRRRMRQQQMEQRQFEIGDEVVTTGGIIGKVLANDGSRISLEIAEGTVIEVLPQAIARRIEPPVSETFEDETYYHDDADGHDHDLHGHGDHGHEEGDDNEVDESEGTA